MFIHSYCIGYNIIHKSYKDNVYFTIGRVGSGQDFTFASLLKTRFEFY